jgi:glyoxylase-like metal-dependent hydrolase (beta-lactamase superfamily II)
VSDRFYFRQWLGGRDFARGDTMATQMRNFAYAIGDRETGEAMLVDPAYHPDELVTLLANDGMRVVGALATHYHFDHVGGSFRGMAEVAGISELLAAHDVPIHVQTDEATWIERGTGVAPSQLVHHRGGDVVMVGQIPITLLHTPGHTPGSQCLLVEEHLVSGDTLFLEGCGRTDLPGSDPEAMYETLSVGLANVSAATQLYPGHLYSAASSAPMAEVREQNYVLAPLSKDQWLNMFGR